MPKTYQELAKDNQYLYGQMENCTQLMGLALLNDQDKQYRDFLRLREEIKKRVDINLDLIEEIWYAPIIEHPAGRRPVNVSLKAELAIYRAVGTGAAVNVVEMAKKYRVSEFAVKNIINKYNTVNG